MAPDAEIPLSQEQIEWADLILVMENSQRSKLNQKFKSALAGKRIAVLNIPDNYTYMQPELISLLRRKCTSYIP